MLLSAQPFRSLGHGQTASKTLHNTADETKNPTIKAPPFDVGKYVSEQNVFLFKN